MEAVTLLQIDLAIEPDMQRFARLLMDSVAQLRGNVFQAAAAWMTLSRRLRASGAASGRPFPLTLRLEEDSLRLVWGQEAARVLPLPPVDAEEISALQAYLQRTTAMLDPQLLLQRNAAIERHLQETRERMERELAALQETLRHRQAELQASLREAETDPLTGLWNRRAFDERLTQAFRHTMRQRNSPLSLVLLDLDHFKEVNDRHGHQYGDAYLVRMGIAMKSVIREDVDAAFRFGGDEFAMMIYADYGTACEKARLVLHDMEGKVSIGIATIDKKTPPDFTLEDFIQEADAALYEAKHRGRGRAVVRPCGQADSHGCQFTCVQETAHV